MFNSKSRRSGLLGTILFHVCVFLFCFFSSIGYNAIDIPSGLEIALIPYQEQYEKEDVNQGDNLSTTNSEFINDNSVEKIIVEDNETVTIPSAEDTLSLSDFNDDKSLVISSELSDALSKLNHNNMSVASNDTVLVHSNDLVFQMSQDPDKNNHIEDGYQLSDNRFAIRKIKPNYSCEEFGKVVVRVWVDRSGKTIKAEPGVRGTTESASCLLNEAKLAALKTTWTPYLNAPDIQIGQITYNFHKY